MKNIEEIYNQAISLMQKGHSQEQVLLKFVEYKDELAPLLSLTDDLITMPKNIVPTPLKQRKYAAAVSKNFWLAWVHISKFAAGSVAVMLLVSAFAGVSYAAWNSAPGQALFAFKKSEEKLQLILATSQTQKANFQLAIAQNRLSEAQAIFSDPQSGSAQKNAALNELADQTSNAVAAVDTAAKDSPQSDANPPLLNSLENLTSQQQTLLTQIKPDSQTEAATNNALVALNQTSRQLSQIKESVAVADSDQALTQLGSNPNSVAVLGDISQISASQITVEKTAFFINLQTAIQDADGNNLTVADLSTGEKVNVIGTQNQNVLVAEQISVADSASTTPVVAANTATSTQSTTTVVTTFAAGSSASTSSTTVITAKTDTDNSQTKDATTTATSTATNTGTAVGTFIFENPSPQFTK